MSISEGHQVSMEYQERNKKGHNLKPVHQTLPESTDTTRNMGNIKNTMVWTTTEFL
jgi:hypothetical protein